jgi:MFS family permease
MKSAQIRKLYLSNLLTGLVFWYAIEKLFMASIGIDAVGVGVATTVYVAFILVADIPSGVLADRWSRRGVLLLSAVMLAVASLWMGLSENLLFYTIGEIFFGAYVVFTSGTYAAITYDILHEENRTKEYSKIFGRAYALFLIGAGIADVLSGFLADHTSYQTTYFVSIVFCVLNILVLLSLREPRFHKPELKEKMLTQLKEASSVIVRLKLLRALVVVLTTLAVAELFKLDFGQLYFLRYFDAPQIIGVLWGIYAFTWSLGSLIAHHFRARLHTLIIFSVVPFVVMSFVDSRWSVTLFMVQAVASAALTNQVETRIQENTPSHVRASIMSVVSTLGRIISLPAALVLGWLFRDYGALAAVRFVAVIASLALLFWVLVSRKMPKADMPIKAETE